MNGKYSYSPRGRGFNIYLNNPNGGTKVDYVMDEEEARRKVYELNGWTYKPKGYTGEMVQLKNPKGETKSFTADEFDILVGSSNETVIHPITKPTMQLI